MAQIVLSFQKVIVFGNGGLVTENLYKLSVDNGYGTFKLSSNTEADH